MRICMGKPPHKGSHILFIGGGVLTGDAQRLQKSDIKISKITLFFVSFLVNQF